MKIVPQMTPSAEEDKIRGPDDGSNVWSSPDVGRMNELSAEWYRKVLLDSLELQFNMISSIEMPKSSNPSLSNSSIPSDFYSQPDCYAPFSDLMEDFQSLPPPPLIPTCCDDELQSEAAYFERFLRGDISAPTVISNQFATTPATTCSTSSPFPQRGRGRKYSSNNLLAHQCQRLLCITAQPKAFQIAEVIRNLKAHHPNVPEKRLKSQVREWFRKRREYLATKIYRSCDRLLPKPPNGLNSMAMNSLLNSIHENHSLIEIILIEARLPMSDKSEKLAFVHEKIDDYYLKYPQRRLRNCRVTTDGSNGVNEHDF